MLRAKPIDFAKTRANGSLGSKDLENLIPLDDSQRGKVNNDVLLAKEVAKLAIAAVDRVDRLVKQAFGGSRHGLSPKALERIRQTYTDFIANIHTFSYLVDSIPGGLCNQLDGSACYSSAKPDTIILSNLDFTDPPRGYFVALPTERAVVLIHEFVHALLKTDHPGGVFIYQLPSDTVILPADAIKNPHCYGNLARWVSEPLKRALDAKLSK